MAKSCKGAKFTPSSSLQSQVPSSFGMCSAPSLKTFILLIKIKDTSIVISICTMNMISEEK